MAAPNITKWGSIRGAYGRIGIATTVTKQSDNTTVSVHIQVWFWSKYSVSDTSNTFYYNNGASEATTSMGSVSIHTTSDSGGWSETNQVKLLDQTYTYNRGTSVQNRSVAAKLNGIDRVGASLDMTASTTYTIPALDSYTIKYNANGGTGAPSNQTVYYSKTITLSATKPTRTGYTFQGWAITAGGDVVYQPSQSYSRYYNTTLYAIWTANTYTVQYNANGGTGAPSNQTKTHGVDLMLSSTVPTRTNYTFKGWGTSAASTTVSYATGAKYTANASVTLYAIWELAYVAPIITNLSVDRSTSSGTVSDEGTYLLVEFDWLCETEVSSITVQRKRESASSWTTTGVTGISGTSGHISRTYSLGSGSEEYMYDVRVTVADANGQTIVDTQSPAIKFELDFLYGGGGVAIGKPADKQGFEVAYDAYFDKSVYANDRDLSTLINTSSSQPSSQTIDSLWLKIEETLNEIKKITPYIKTSSGYDKLALSSNSVYLSNNNTLENFFLSFASPSFTTVYNVNSNLIRAVRLGNIVLMQFSITMPDTTERTLNMNGTWKPFSGFFVPLTRVGQLAANAWLSSSGSNTTLTYAAASSNYGSYTASVVYYSESDDPLIQNGDEVNY